MCVCALVIVVFIQPIRLMEVNGMWVMVGHRSGNFVTLPRRSLRTLSFHNQRRMAKGKEFAHCVGITPFNPKLGIPNALSNVSF